jgi:hypothetical protein
MEPVAAPVPALAGLPLALVAQLPPEALALQVLAANQPVRLQVPAVPVLADPGLAQRLCWLLRQALAQLPAPEQDPGMAQATWRRVMGMLPRALSPEGLQELLPVLSDQVPQSPRCARLELAAMLGWLLGAVPADEG